MKGPARTQRPQHGCSTAARLREGEGARWRVGLRRRRPSSSAAMGGHSPVLAFVRCWVRREHKEKRKGAQVAGHGAGGRTWRRAGDL